MPTRSLAMLYCHPEQTEASHSHNSQLSTISCRVAPPSKSASLGVENTKTLAPNPIFQLRTVNGKLFPVGRAVPAIPITVILSSRTCAGGFVSRRDNTIIARSLSGAGGMATRRLAMFYCHAEQSEASHSHNSQITTIHYPLFQTCSIGCAYQFTLFDQHC